MSVVATEDEVQIYFLVGRAPRHIHLTTLRVDLCSSSVRIRKDSVAVSRGCWKNRGSLSFGTMNKKEQENVL